VIDDHDVMLKAVFRSSRRRFLPLAAVEGQVHLLKEFLNGWRAGRGRRLVATVYLPHEFFALFVGRALAHL
jgi:hypothetical protein